MKYVNGSEVVGEDVEDQENPRHGYVFYYQSLNMCKILEFEVADKETEQDLARFEEYICKILFVNSEQIRILSTDKRSIVAIQKKEYMKYMIKASLPVLLR